MKAKCFRFILFLSLGLSSCSDETLLDKNEVIEGKVWMDTQSPEFEVEVKETSTPYNVYLNLRNSPEFPFAKVYVLVHMENPDQSRSTYRVGLKLANRDGLWTGQSAGNLYSHQALFLKNFRFPDSGTYRFHLQSNMRLSPLPGISDVGLRIAPTGIK